MPSDYKIDSRMRADIRAQIKELSAAYTPEWVFDSENPDIGSVIGLIFADQLEENISRVNQLTDKYRSEFVNMLNIGLLPAFPAQGVAVMELIQDTIAGVEVPAGTKLLGSADEGMTVFETTSDIYVTNSRIRSLLAISPHFGKIIPLMGELQKTALIPQQEQSGQESDTGNIPVVSLFDFSAPGIQQNALLIYHKSVFDTRDDIAVSVRILSSEGADLSGVFADSKLFRWKYYDGKALVPFESVSSGEGEVLLRRSGEMGKLRLPEGGTEDKFSLICIEALGRVKQNIDFKTLQISSFCKNAAPSFLSHNESNLEAESFMPFGELASIFDDCFIGQDQIFNQPGAAVTISFNLSYKEKLATFTPEQTEEQLKVIKKKPRQVVFDTARTCVERVSFEYFNGIGWKPVVFTEDWSTMFDGHVSGDIEMTFVCPDDWQPVTIGGSVGRALRLRVAQADNCYLQPCLHNMPRISGLSVSYSYLGHWKQPQHLKRVCGTALTDLTEKLLSEKSFTAFAPLPYSENAFYLGFDRKIEGSPVSLFFEVEESAHFSGAALRFEYSTAKGFVKLQVRDNTKGLSGSGTLMFIPGGDFTQVEVEGEKRYWIRIVDDGNAYNNEDGFHPVIRRILPNAAAIHNVQTMEEETFYIDAASPGMSFPLSANNILSADVFVNERRLSAAAMQQMKSEQPDNVRAEYNHLGNISSFFVRWTEVENFDNSAPGDRHYVLDRMTNRICFGDGVNVMIPSAGNDTAFTVQVRCCDGGAGNLPPEAVEDVMGNLLYINRVYNPISTYAGSDMESPEQALRRGANLLNAKNRLVSELDFVREAKAYSSLVGQAKCVIGQDAGGKKNSRAVNMIILMRDFDEGPHSFNGIRDRLKSRLLEKSETTLTEGDLSVIEPIFVTISLDVWIELHGTAGSFEQQSLILDKIRAYLEPIPREKGYAGWKIGELPGVSQLRVMLHSIRCDAIIRHFTATARYIEHGIPRERELTALEGNPFMLGVNGAHRIHILSNTL